MEYDRIGKLEHGELLARLGGTIVTEPLERFESDRLKWAQAQPRSTVANLIPRDVRLERIASSQVLAEIELGGGQILCGRTVIIKNARGAGAARPPRYPLPRTQVFQGFQAFGLGSSGERGIPMVAHSSILVVKLTYDWSKYPEKSRMSATTVIAASEAKAKFSELLNRVQEGESFSITLHGEETAKLVPAKRPSLDEIQDAIAQIKQSRSVLNPPGLPKIKVKDLINEGRP